MVRRHGNSRSTHASPVGRAPTCLDLAGEFAVRTGPPDGMARASTNDHVASRRYARAPETIGFRSVPVGGNYCPGLTAWRSKYDRTMSESDDVNDAVQRVRDAFESVIDETEEMSEEARERFEEAFEDLEQRIEALRDRD